jgi:hypothetical protein
MWDVFRSTLSPMQWALLALVPPAILALYFLKLKRRPLVVPSTYLWKKSLEDLHVNSLWQRLRKSILLFLQLLLVLLAMLSLLRPGWQSMSLEGDRFIIMVDNSASMSATDFEGNRLAAAVARAHAVVDQMPSGAEAMLMTFAGRPQVLQEFTTNRSLLRTKIDTIQPTHSTTELREALEIVSGLANPPQVKSEFDTEFQVVEERPATVYILSDGRFPSVESFSLGNLYPKFIPVGTTEAANLAVTTFNTRPSDVRPGERQAFAEVSNLSKTDATATAELWLDGVLQDAKELSIPAGGATGIAFSLIDVLAGKLRLVIGSQDVADMLELDNVGYAAVNDTRRGSVLLVTAKEEVLIPALSTERVSKVVGVEFQAPEFLKTDAYKQAAVSDTYDLIVYDRCRPEEGMPRANTLFLGAVPRFPPWAPLPPEVATSEDSPPPESEKISPLIVDWNRAHPLMAFVELGDVLVAESYLLDVPLGGTSLIEAGQGTIGAIAPREHFEDAVLGFSLITESETGEEFFNTDWPQRQSFPTFWLNVMEYFAGRMGEAGERVVRAGETVEFTVELSPDRVTVIAPSGERSQVARDRSGLYQFQETEELGVYEVRHNDQTVHRFAVNLFDRDESDVALRVQADPESEDGQLASVRIGFEDVKAETGWKPMRRETWRWLLLAALAVLVLEWYIYNRRAYI